MSKKNNFILGVIKASLYVTCLVIIVMEQKTELLLVGHNIKEPIIYIENLALRCLVLATFLTVAGFGFVKAIMKSNKIKSGITDKYLASIFFILGVSSLFFPITINKILTCFLLSILLNASYLASIHIYNNKEVNHLG